ncbi:MAG: SPASM domain-containing protein [Candidatus Omnitrophica bacterium]|nr:SPASM domain-containing protein [Candidatus Omnitrophota bacterium]
MKSKNIKRDKRVEAEQYASGVFPKRVEVELASACNLKCVYCPRKHAGRLDGFMELGLFKKIIDEISEYPDTILVLHRRGESLLHPEFIEACGYVKGKFTTVQLATNASLLDDDKSKAIIDALDFISFSIDIPQVFNKTRIPAKYDDIERKIARFLELNNGKIETQVSMVKTSDTPQENGELFKKIWKNRVDRVRIYEEHSRDGKFGSLDRNRGKRVPCTMPFYEMLIYCDGKVGRCNHDWQSGPMGDVCRDSIRDIWHSDKYRDLRNQHRTLMIDDRVCSGCDSWYPIVGQQDTGELLK